MNRPDWRRDGEEFVFAWPAVGVEITLTGIREGREGLTAEVTVEASGKAALRSGHLHWANLNLASTQARSNLARHLQSRMELGDWPGLLEQACAIAAREFRRGEPTVRLCDVPRQIGTRELVSKLMPAGETTTIFADGGSLKSLLALSVGMSVATMLPLPGGLEPCDVVNVLYLDYETNAREQADRLRMLAAGLGADVPDNVHYRAMFRPLPDEAAKLRAEISRLEIGLVIVDSIAPACGGNIIDQDVATRFFNALRSFTPATRLVVSHVSKAGAEQKSGAATPYGSAFVTNLSRSVWELRKSSDDSEDANRVSVGLYHRKANGSRLQRPIGLTASFGEGEIVWTTADVAGNGELAAHAALSFRLREALRSGARTVPELSEVLDEKPDTVSKRLHRMEDAIQLEKGGGRGKPATWGLRARAS